MGVIYHKKNQPSKAIGLFKKAVSVDKFYLDALYNLIILEIETSNFNNAFENFLFFLKIDRNNPAALLSLSTLLKIINFTQYQPEIENHIVDILNYKNLINLTELCIPTIKILNLNPKFLLLKNKILNDEKLKLDEFTKNVREFPLLLKMMALVPIPDLDIEILLTKIRKNFFLN